MMAKKHESIRSVENREGVKVVQLQGNYIVLDENNSPLTKRYPIKDFRFVQESAKTVVKMSEITGQPPSDAIVALANYVPSGHKIA